MGIKRILIAILNIPNIFYFYFKGSLILRLKKKNPKKYEKKWPLERRFNFCKNFIKKILIFSNHEPEYTNLKIKQNFNKGIILTNHSSILEPLLVTLTFNKPIIWITKSENKQHFWTNILTVLSGSLFIDRNNPKKASLVLLEASRLIKKGHIIGICPEGTRSKSNKLLPFKKDIFRFLKMIKSDILIIGVTNCHKAFKKRENHKDTLKLKFLKILKPKDYEDLTHLELLNKCKNPIADYLKTN